MSNPKFMLGYDYMLYARQNLKATIYTKFGHLCATGASNSGKSTALLYWLYKMRHLNVDLWVADFKKSGEFSGITENFAEFEATYELIQKFYEIFLSLPEGGDGRTHILLIDELAGTLNYYGMTRDGKSKAENIRSILGTVLMLGRSRRTYVWLSMQRYSASIFPSASGAGDNFHICVGLGNLSVEGRKGLFAGEHFEGEDELQFGQGRGIVLIDGQPLKALIIPKVSKKKLLTLLRK